MAPAKPNLKIIKQAYDVSPETEIKEHDGQDYVFYDGQPITPLGTKKALDYQYCHPEQGYSFGRCTMIKSDGDRCPNPVREGWRVCRYHGAGSLMNPGGTSARHAKYLPTHLSQRFEEFISDPDALSLYSEMALIDTRVTELTERLDSNDNKLAWMKVDQAILLLRKIANLHENVDRAYMMLMDAKTMPADEQAIWGEINKLVDTRRRLAATEQARIIAAKQFLTVAEANSMLAAVMDIVIQNITDSNTRQVIADKLRDLVRD